MPKPYIFVICEKVIIDVNNVASLIGLFNKITASVVGEVPIDAAAPKESTLFTSWDLEPFDKGKEYLQFFEIHYPDGRQFGQRVSVTVKMGEGKRANSIANSQAIPIGQSGEYTVMTWLEDGQSNQVGERLSLVFEIEITKQTSTRQ